LRVYVAEAGQAHGLPGFQGAGWHRRDSVVVGAGGAQSGGYGSGTGWQVGMPKNAAGGANFMRGPRLFGSGRAGTKGPRSQS
jgi:hypothetical protein